MTSLPSLFKQIGNYNPADGLPSAETSIIVDQTGLINAGKPFTITFAEDGIETAWPMTVVPNLIIRDYFSRAVLKQVAWPGGGYRGFAVNQTIGGLVHIFATQDPDNVANANAFVHATLDPNFNLGPTQTIWTGAALGGGIKAVMGIASPNPQGGWSVSYANQWGTGALDWPDANFTPLAASASNPNGWTNATTGLPFTKTQQSCSEQWSASDQYWYAYIQNLQYDAAGNASLLWTTMARSKDRINWTYSSKVFLTPQDMPSIEGIDNSDIRMVEYQGQTYIVYLDGDQKTWSNIRTAIYSGSLTQIRAQFF